MRRRQPNKASVLAGAAVFTLLLSGDGMAFDLKLAPNPKRYFRELPLGTITQDELIRKLGLPAERLTVGDAEHWMYVVSSADSPFTRKSYTYVLIGGVIADVIYNDGGPWNGISAKTEQAK